MKYLLLVLCSAVFVGAYAPDAWAQSDGLTMPELGFCDPLMMSETDEQDGDEDVNATTTRRYDLEQSEVLGTEQAIMTALYEEKWDLASGTPVTRHELCESEPSYVVHWAEVMSRDEDGKLFPAAKGLFSFRKDGTFRFLFEKRPYDGRWALDGVKMRLTADWLDEGRPLVVPVERVRTPVEVVYSDGRDAEYYNDDVYRVGYFRLLRISTTLKGQLQDCKCQ